MTLRSPHLDIREAWLAQGCEEVLSPEQPIFDAHHHLWDRPGNRYRAAELMKDMSDGHDVRASLYVQCRTGYRGNGPDEMRPLGEIETILDWGHDTPNHPIGIVGFADLQLGDAVGPVLDALIEAGVGRLKGIRNTTAYHADPAVRSNPNPAPDGLLRCAAFRDGARAVASRNLSMDIWAYHTQLHEVHALAHALPDLTVILDHCGGPLGVGPYLRGDPEHFQQWRSALARLAELPNTRIKIGGFGLSVMGYDYADDPLPPHSSRMATDWAPWVETCLDLFGTRRAMFESNFPVDKGQFGYRALWNAFKRLSEPLTDDERHDVFWRSAARAYGVEEQLFWNDIGRTQS